MIRMRVMLVVVISAVLASFGLFAPTVASAASVRKHVVSRSFTLTRYWWSAALKAYIEVRVSGTATALAVYVPNAGKVVAMRYLRDFTVRDPKIRVTAYTSATKKKRKKLSGIVARDLYYDPHCGVELSGVSISGTSGGFGLGAAFTYRCSTEVVAKRISNFRSVKGSRWSMAASGTRLLWSRREAQSVMARTIPTICTQPQVGVSIYQKRKGDSFSYAPGAVCLSYSM